MGLKRFSCKSNIIFASKNIKEQNSRNRISFCERLKRKYHHAKVPLKRFHLSDHAA